VLCTARWHLRSRSSHIKLSLMNQFNIFSSNHFISLSVNFQLRQCTIFPQIETWMHEYMYIVNVTRYIFRCSGLPLGQTHPIDMIYSVVNFIVSSQHDLSTSNNPVIFQHVGIIERVLLYRPSPTILKYFISALPTAKIYYLEGIVE